MKSFFCGILILMSLGVNAQKFDNTGKAEMYAGLGLLPLQSFLFLGSNGNASMQLSGVVSGFMGGDYFTGKYFALGAQLNYYNNKYNYRNPIGQVDLRRDQIITTMVRMRANWVNREKFSLYSSFAAGACVHIENKPQYSISDKNATVYPAYQWSYIGIRVGGDAAFFAEFGNGFQGFLSAGFSARF